MVILPLLMVGGFIDLVSHSLSMSWGRLFWIERGGQGHESSNAEDDYAALMVQVSLERPHE